MARLAQGHEITVAVVAASADRQDMMYLLHGSDPAFFETHLAQWMCFCVPRADPVPCPAVLFIVLGGPLISVVKLSRLRSVPITILSVR